MAEHPDPLVVVLAEDDPNDQELVRDGLLELEHPSDLYCVGNGRQLKAYLEGEYDFGNRIAFPVPDLVIMDLDMPEMSGQEALRWIRSDTARHDIPVAILTGRHVDRNLVTSLEGASVYQKPFEFDDLVMLLHNLMVLVETQKRSTR